MGKQIANPGVSVNSVDLTDHCAAVTINETATEVKTTAFGDGWDSVIGGIKAGSVTISFHSDFAASSVNATLDPLLGSYATVVVKSTPGTAPATPTSPSYTAVCMVSSLTPYGGAVGDLLTQDVTWPVTGAITKGTS